MLIGMTAIVTSCSSKIGSEKFFVGTWSIIQAEVKIGDNTVTPEQSELGTITFTRGGFKAEGKFGVNGGYLGYLERSVENGRWEFNRKTQQMKLNDALWDVKKKNNDLIELHAMIQRLGGRIEEYRCLLTRQ